MFVSTVTGSTPHASARSRACAWSSAIRSRWCSRACRDRKSTRLNSSHTDIYPLSLHDALPIYVRVHGDRVAPARLGQEPRVRVVLGHPVEVVLEGVQRSEEHTSELQSH